jgi:hypothetical protein
MLIYIPRQPLVFHFIEINTPELEMSSLKQIPKLIYTATNEREVDLIYSALLAAGMSTFSS